MFLLKRNNMEENTDGLNTNEVSTIEVYEFVGTDATNSGSDYTGSNYTGSDYTGSDYTGDCARRYTCRICLEEEDDDSTLVATVRRQHQVRACELLAPVPSTVSPHARASRTLRHLQIGLHGRGARVSQRSIPVGGGLARAA